MKNITVMNIYPGDKIIETNAKNGHNTILSEKYPNNKLINVKITSKLNETQVVIDTGLHK
jgi:hypothetical protein